MARGAWGLKVLAIVLGLLFMGSTETMQLNVNHRLDEVVQRINESEEAFLGLLLSSGRDLKALMTSGYYIPAEYIPPLTIAGREFIFGYFKDALVVVTWDGQPMAAVGSTVQILVDRFQVKGIIAFGPAGNLDTDLNIGDVVIPHRVGFTGVWQWQAYNSLMGKNKVEDLPSLDIARYNVDGEDNKLGSIEYQRVTVYTPTNAKKKTFWFPIDDDWLNIAATIEGFNVNCSNSNTLCNPQVVHRKSIASSDIYVSNKAYAEFLNVYFGVSAVDTSSAAVAQAAKANGVPYIMFKGALDKPGQQSETKVLEAVSRNVVEVVAKFVELITPSPDFVKRY